MSYLSNKTPYKDKSNNDICVGDIIITDYGDKGKVIYLENMESKYFVKSLKTGNEYPLFLYYFPQCEITIFKGDYNGKRN